MKRNWTSDELLDHFTILETELNLAGQITGFRRLGLLVVLKFFQIEARFPSTREEIPQAIINFLAQQLKKVTGYFWEL